jgi:YVTN family beta-propeller protein
VIASIATGNGSYASTWDPASDAIYTTNRGSNNLSVIDASTAKVTASIPVPGAYWSLQGLAFDTVNGTVWVAGGASALAVVNASRNAVVAYSTSDPSGVGYDPQDNAVCLTNTGNFTFECFVMSTPEYVASPAEVSTVTVNESGLPSGTSWSAWLNISGDVSASGTTSTSALVFGEDAVFNCYGDGLGQGVFSVPAVAGYLPSPASGSLSLCGVSESWENVTFRPAAGTYPVDVNETGLPSVATWGATVGLTSVAGTNSTLEVWLANGTYSVSIGPAGLFDPTSRTSQVTVQGGLASIAVQFISVTVAVFPVTFQASRLPPGTPWEVSAQGPTGLAATAGTTAGLTLYLLNGTYSYHGSATGYSPTPWSGNVTVQGAAANVTIDFESAVYLLAFQESGLPTGTPFEVSLAGQSNESGVGSLVFDEPNGTYEFTVAPSGGMYPEPSHGNATIDGTDLTVNVTFGIYTDSVTFLEQGLPAGTVWAIDFNGTTISTGGTFLLFYATNGTYPYSILPIPGYDSRTGGSVKVAGGSVPVSVGFAPDLFALEFHATGLPAGTGWGILVGSQVQSGLSPNLTFVEPNGTFGYVILDVPGYVSAGSGVVTVNGSAASVVVAFHSETYPIVFVELGLPAGSNWSVTVADAGIGFHQTQSTTGNVITFFLANGTYSVTFTLPAGFTANGTSTQVTVAGRATTGASVTVVPPATTELPGARGVAWPFLAAAAVLVVAVGIVALLSWRRRPPTAPPPTETGP